MCKAARTGGWAALLTALLCAGCAPGGDGATGDPCASSAECDSGLCLPADPFTGGYCASGCGASTCGAGEVCSNFNGNLFCLKACDDAAACREGYQCFRGTCFPGCTSDALCGRGYGCKAGQCVPLAGKANAEGCASDEECSSRYCEPVSRTCRVTCASEAACPKNFTCFANPVDTDGDGNTDELHPICVTQRFGASAPGSACARDSDCALGGCELGVCTTLCEGAGQCAAPTRCQQSFIPTEDNAVPVRACLPTSGLLEFNLGPYTGGALGVPENAVSLTFYAEAKGQNQSYFTGMTDLSDAVDTLYSMRTGFYENPLRYQPSPGASTMLISNSPLVPFRPNSVYVWSGFAVNEMGGSIDFNVRARIKLAEQPQPAGGKIALHVYVTNLTGACKAFNAASAPETLAAFEKQLRDIFLAGGIEFDEIKYMDTDVANTVTQGDNGYSPSINNLLKTVSANGPPGVIELTIVKRINSETQQQGFEVLGVAGGIPASSGIPGTIHSGAVVSLSSLCMDKTQRQFATTVAHELGHTLGLFHNIESDGSTDQMTDNDGDKDTNLMYWAEGNRNQTRISPMQVQAIIGNPVVRLR